MLFTCSINIKIYLINNNNARYVINFNSSTCCRMILAVPVQGLNADLQVTSYATASE